MARPPLKPAMSRPATRAPPKPLRTSPSAPKTSCSSTSRSTGRKPGCATAEEYLAAANAVVANPAALHKLQAEDGDDLYFLESTGEFVVVSPAGYLRTYYLTDRDYFERQ